MTAQTISYGRTAKTLLLEGLHTVKSTLPLGYYHDDGLRRYRYAQVALTSCKPGMGLQQRLSVASPTWISGAAAQNMLRSCMGGFGNAAGDMWIKVYSAGGLTTDKYVNGYFDVLSGVGAGHSYQIDTYETGVASKTTKIKLDEPLVVKLSNRSRVRIRTNPYWGLKLPLRSINNQAARMVSAGPGVGVTTVSAAASGYMFIQTRGPGVGYANQAISAGYFVGFGLSGKISAAMKAVALGSTVWGISSLVPMGVCRGGAAGITRLCAVDWKIE